jgi:DeoR/GlpR family transcriptional regulator of sugar metabolism
MATALKEERQQLILDSLRHNRQVTVAELSRRFNVSEVTIRRDLRKMARQGMLQRAHGGAIVTTPAPPEAPVIQRMNQAQIYKECIARTAAELVNDGESIFLSSGSTTTYVARHLLDCKNLTVVTNALNIAIELAGARDITVVVVGGVMRPSELSVIGHITQLALREVRVDKVMMGMQAISLEEGMTHDYLPDVTTARAIIEKASELIVVADHTKFGKVAAAYIAPVERMTKLVTDSLIDAETLARLERMGIDVIVTEVNEQGAPTG